MENCPDNLTYDDCTQIYFYDLAASKVVGDPITAEELNDVSVAAAHLYLGEAATAEAVDQLSKSASHPFGRLWGAGLLNFKSYYEWSMLVEREIAKKQIASMLAAKRKTRTE